MAIGPAAYARQLQGLLPRGRAWTRAAGSVLDHLLAALAAAFSRLDGAATALLDESLASRAFDLLPEWEAEFGLPDKCSGLAATIPERRAAVVHKQVTRRTAAVAEFHRIASLYGIAIQIEELNQARADAIPGLDTANGRWRFVWWIEIPTDAQVRYFTTLSDVNEPLASWDRVPGHAELECRLRELVPAHTHLVFRYQLA